ncbi:hypothetical protein F2Q69_00008699 [Brassica cretica]|uniref:Uncharacterized protein n=1 Tax=Brassica cretica TaxID=69181 RepID=A0A8S9NP03_BRACR|nr:hypothetical protein F2Q69_00008699 [Brassica cretica]
MREALSKSKGLEIQKIQCESDLAQFIKAITSRQPPLRCMLSSLIFYVWQNKLVSEAFMNYRSLVSCGHRSLESQHTSSSNYLKVVGLWNYNKLMRLILLPFLCEMDGQNSIIIVGGANMRGWTKKMSHDELEIVRNAGGVLLQREIPDSINIQVVKVLVPVILDVGEMDTPIPNELLDRVDVLSSNETELSLLTGKHTETFEQFSQAVAIS